MKIWFIDYESYYDQTYSLRKMTPVEYILDPRFECIGAAVKPGVDGKSYWIDGGNLPAFFQSLDPNDTMLVSHNALFDACITAWRFNFVPKLTVCTLSIARAVLGHKLRSLSLDNVARELNLGIKGKTIHKVVGMGSAAIKAAGLYDEYIQYATDDADLCAGIFKRLVHEGQFPVNELVLLDRVIRCTIEPKFMLDQNVLAEHLYSIKAHKEQLLQQAMMIGLDGKADLMSNEKFAETLRSLGVDPPMKTSLATGKETYAFAKTDPAFIELEEHENPAVQALVAARMGHKTTLEESRTERFLNISRLTWPGNQQGLMPMPLRYSGAHTHRLCLVGDTIIVVLRNNRVVSIVLSALEPNDLVWDGEMFVAHGGLAYAGYKEVIEYDGVVGTPDHRVWTVERGYQELAHAKARGYNIARGGVPDATRIDPALRRAYPVQDESSLHLREVQCRDVIGVERHSSTYESLVPLLPQDRADGRAVTLEGNAPSGCSCERGAHTGAESTLGAGRTAPVGTAFCARAGKDSLEEVAPFRLEGRDGYGCPCEPTMHESRNIKLSILRGAGDTVPVSINGDDGRLVVDEPRPTPKGRVIGSDRLRRSLRVGESQVGDEGRAISEPFVLPTWDIVDCGPRNRFMANGRIVHNSGDWKLNVQNMPRGGALRRALIAPPGHKVVAVDASQIEARIVAWLAGQRDLIDQFDRGEDVYSNFASTVFGRPINKKDHPTERFIGKTCLAEGTLVLTQRGYKPIQYLTTNDQLWDGVEWVRHEGLLPQGVKPTISHRGLTATGDHEILTERGWVEWNEVHTNHSLFQSALRSASSPCSGTSATKNHLEDRRGGILSFAALAGGKGASTGVTLRPGEQHDATHAQRSRLRPSGTGIISMRWMTTGTARAYSTVCPPRSVGVTTQSVMCINITDSAASPCMVDGETTERVFSLTSRLSKGGTFQNTKWIGSTWIAVTCQVTFGLFRAVKTFATNAVSRSSKSAYGVSKQSLPTYDLANAGPRKRFTVLTDDGPVIVHNCILGLGYGLGWPKFQRSVKMQSKAQVGRVIELSDAEAIKIVETYRKEAYPAIPIKWRELNSAIEVLAQGGGYKIGPCVFEKGAILLPSGLRLHYHKLVRKEDGWWYEYAMKPKRVYGGSLMENISQALARIIVMDAAMRLDQRFAKAGIKFALQVHDELCFVVPEAAAPIVKAICLEEMARRPSWAPDLPLASECDIGDSYGEAK